MTDLMLVVDRVGLGGAAGCSEAEALAALRGVLKRMRFERAVRAGRRRSMLVRCYTGRLWLHIFAHILDTRCARCGADLRVHHPADGHDPERMVVGGVATGWPRS